MGPVRSITPPDLEVSSKHASHHSYLVIMLRYTLYVCRHGTCREMSGDYELTSTPGRFFYHISSTSLCLCVFSCAILILLSDFSPCHPQVWIGVTFLPVLLSGWQADVDAYVVHTNYNEYAIMVMVKQKSSGDKSTSVKLYSEWKLWTPSLFATFFSVHFKCE